MKTDSPFHDQAISMMNCGENLLIRPSIGSWITYGLGTENQNLPGFVALAPSRPGHKSYRSAFLPNIYQGTFLNTKESTPDKILENIRNERLSTSQQRQQLDLINELNRLHLQSRGTDELLEGRIQTQEQAFRVQLAASDVLDLRGEPTAIVDMYGDTVYGNQMIIARRLIESGVRFVQLWPEPGIVWDSHRELEKNHRKLAGDVSRPIAALIKDLKQRGLLGRDSGGLRDRVRAHPDR